MADSIRRRAFLKYTGLAGAALYRPYQLSADPLGMPIGLELYTVRADLEQDFEGTLKRTADIGYRTVEPYSFLNRPASAWRRTLEANSLKLPVGHYKVDELRTDLDRLLNYAHEVGIPHIVCSSPGVADASRPKDMKSLAPTLTIDDWRWMADFFNSVGERCAKAGFGFGYHNHNVEFRTMGGVVPFDELMTRTDPKFVKLELDCGWVARTGQDPVAFLKRFPERVLDLHIKDLRKGFAPSTELDPTYFTEIGHGIIDWKRLFAAARTAGVQYYFVEQDYTTLAPFESAKLSYGYLHRLQVEG